MANYVQDELAQVKQIEGVLDANNNVKIGLVVGRFNSFVVESLVDGAVDTLLRHGVRGKNIAIVRVPGAWEIPFAVARMAKTGHFDAIIALGAVIRGSTPHFDFVAGESAKGLGAISLQHDVPVINAILTTDSIEQAIERSGTKAGNKGSEASVTALEMINVLSDIEHTVHDMREEFNAEYWKSQNRLVEQLPNPQASVFKAESDDTFNDDDMPF